MTTLFFSRARLRPDLGRLGPVLFPDDPSARMSVSHRLVWSLFPADLAQRPFLYRENSPRAARGRALRREFLILSTIAPGDGGGLFDVETKPFEPALAAGDRLRFSLRANPAKNRRAEDGRATRSDVVMLQLHALGREERAEKRRLVVRQAGLAWLAEQGELAGFRLPEPEAVAADGYEQFAIDGERRGAGRRAGHSRLDFEGILEVTAPDLFLAKMAKGYGRARAFGHGLMLIRRA